MGLLGATVGSDTKVGPKGGSLRQESGGFALSMKTNWLNILFANRAILNLNTRKVKR